LLQLTSETHTRHIKQVQCRQQPRLFNIITSEIQLNATINLTPIMR